MAKTWTWEKEAKKLTEKEKAKIIKSLEVLIGWQFFDREYTEMAAIKYIIETSSLLQMSKKKGVRTCRDSIKNIVNI